MGLVRCLSSVFEMLISLTLDFNCTTSLAAPLAASLLRQPSTCVISGHCIVYPVTCFGRETHIGPTVILMLQLFIVSAITHSQLRRVYTKAHFDNLASG